MRALPLLLALSLLTVALLPLAMGLPVPGPVQPQLPPWAAHSLPSTGPFSKVTCPGLDNPNPARPLELCNMRATSTNGPSNEIDLAIDPKDSNHQVVVGKGYNTQHILGSGFLLGAVITPYSTTFDGGLTWTEGFLQKFTADLTLPGLGDVYGHTNNWESDPVVEFAPDGSVIVETLRVNNGGGLPIYKSTDGGRTFTEISKAYNGGTDKNWVVSDLKHGMMYTVTLYGGVGFSKSADSGKTWSPMKTICNCVFPGIDVGPNGEIYVIGYDGDHIRFTKSLDFGATWSPDKVIAKHTGVTWNPADLRTSASRTSRTSRRTRAPAPTAAASTSSGATTPRAASRTPCPACPCRRPSSAPPSPTGT